MNAMTEMPAPLVFTDAAASKVKTLIDEEGNPEIKLRVFAAADAPVSSTVSRFDEAVNEDDTSMQKKLSRCSSTRCRSARSRRNRLHRRSRRLAVRHQESERDRDLRLRLVVALT